ncbi:unnamed protein product, partial [Oppiella nova]
MDTNLDNQCMAKMSNKCMKDSVKLHMNDDYYCCQLWDLIDCYQQNYQYDCTYVEQQSIQNDWNLLQLDFSGKVYTQSSCTNQGYQRTMDRRYDCTYVEQQSIQNDWNLLQLDFSGKVYTQSSCTNQGYQRTMDRRSYCTNAEQQAIQMDWYYIQLTFNGFSLTETKCNVQALLRN